MRILTCPFCGEAGNLEDTMFGDSMVEYYRVGCKNGHTLDWWADTVEEAIDVWNTRYTETVKNV
jgi:sarcosine oxidase delta subunit